MKKQIQIYLGWGGFVDGRLDRIDVDTGFGGFGNGQRIFMLAIFKSRAEAMEQYQDVLRMKVREARP